MARNYHFYASKRQIWSVVRNRVNRAGWVAGDFEHICCYEHDSKYRNKLAIFSYGGTSLVMLLAQMGIVLSISRTSRIEKLKKE